MSGRIPSFCGFLGALALVSACELNNPGLAPPRAELNFPLALELSRVEDPAEAPRFLFVANSNFDLRYNSGTVATFDLNVLAADLEAARMRGELPADAIEPPIEISPSQVLRSQVKIGSYASAMVMSPAGDRLYLSIRADSNMTYIDVVEGNLSCGNGGAFALCSDDFRTGDEATANPRRVEVPTNPTGIAVGSAADLGLTDAGDYVIMTHYAGQASLFLDRAAPAGGGGRPNAPLLVDVLSDLNIGQISIRIDPDGIAWMPTVDARRDSTDNFLTRVGVAIDFARPDRSYLFNAGSARLEGINTGEDTRDIAFATASDGTRFAFILSRRPEALVLVDLDQSTPTRLFVRDLISVGFGPSRMELVNLPIGTAGETRLFVFVTCFDSRDVFVVDPLSGRTFTIARTLSGPFELEIDPVRGYMYVTDFRTSVIWIVTLEPLLDCLEGTVTGTSVGSTCEPFRIASIGTPQPVRDLL